MNRLSVRRFFWHDFQLQLLGKPQHGQRGTYAYANIGEHTVEVVDAGDRLAFERDDYVAIAQACPLRRTILFYRQSQRARFFRQVVEAHDAPMHRHSLRRDADEAASNAAIAQQTAGHELRRVDADGKTDSLRRQNRRRIHADYSPSGIDQRPAGVSGVKRSIGLDYVIDQSAGIRGERTP